MVVFHFCYDLTYFKILYFDFYNNQFWIQSRNLIVTLFVFVAGSSLYFATSIQVNWRKYFNRLLLIAAIALAISVVSFYLFPGRTIFFGILHFIAVATVLGIIFRNFYWINLLVGISFIVISIMFKHDFFDNQWFQWIGLMTHKPATEDYAPLFPWFGVFLLGMFVGRNVLQSADLTRIASYNSDYTLYRGLKYFGRHSLLIYVVHQPILMGMLYVVLALTNLG